MRPVAHFRREVRARPGVDVSRYVERLLWRELLGAIDRHEGVNERGGGVYARHSGADVVRLRPPQGRSQRRAHSVRSVTPSARRNKNGRSTTQISLEWLNLWQTLSFDLRSDGHARRQKCEVAHDVAHVPSGWIECAAVHAPLEAVVDSVLDEIDLAAARAVLGEAGVAADPRHCAGLQAAVQMTAGAAERIADVAGQAIACSQEERTAAKCRRAVRAIAQLNVGRNPEPHAWLGQTLLGGRCRVERPPTGVLESRYQRSGCDGCNCVSDPGGQQGYCLRVVERTKCSARGTPDLGRGGDRRKRFVASALIAAGQP